MNAPLPVEPIEPEQAAAIFAEFAVADDLALRFPADGCYARTHWMVQWLLDRGLTPSKGVGVRRQRHGSPLDANAQPSRGSGPMGLPCRAGSGCPSAG